MRFAVVDLFAGAGGLGEGFSRAGFDNVLSCEAKATFTFLLILHPLYKYIICSIYIENAVETDQVLRAVPV